MLTNLMRVPLDRKQLSDFGEREPKLLGPLNKFEVSNFLLFVESVACPSARWSLQQARLFIEADGIDTQAGFLRDLANWERNSADYL